jgi:deoxyribonuclease-4
MRIGAHVDQHDPLAGARAVEADVVQFFLGDPQGWKKPAPREDVDVLRGASIPLYVHAPYLVNLASPNNRIRVPSRKILREHAEAAAEIGAAALIVHGGHVGKGQDPADGVGRWQRTFQMWEPPLPILIENTAGGDNAMARRLDAMARLWDAVAGFDRVGFCLDTCHAHAGGEELVDLVERVLAITGRIDLVHCNNSKDSFDSGRDRHDNLGAGQIDPKLLVAVVEAAGTPVVCETPGGAVGQGSDIAFLRAQLRT